MTSITLAPPVRSTPDHPAVPDSLVEKHFLHRGAGLEFEMEADWIHGHLPQGDGPVLDIGCGIGALFPVIGETRVVGIDNNEAGLKLTRRRFPAVPLICTSADRVPVPEATFDAVTCQHVIEHLPRHDAALREWLRVLKPGGFLLVLTPNGWFADPGVFADDTHVRIFDRDSLRTAIATTGFEISDLRSLGLPWFRRYHGLPGAWRFRRFTTRRAGALSGVPGLRWRGQTLCCAARRPIG